MSLISLPTINRYRFIFEAQSPLLLSDYSGSAWRGLLGHGLRRVSCVTRAKTCDGCLLTDSCVYATIFESSSAGADQGRFQVRPHPFVLALEGMGRRQIAAGEKLELGINLFGKANDSLPYMLQGMTEGGKLGMGRDHAQFVLSGLLQERALGSDQWSDVYDAEEGRLMLFPSTPTEIPLAPEFVDIELLTPLRMKRKGKLVGPREFESADFLRQLWRRVQDIGHFYGEDEPRGDLPLPQSRANSFTDSNISVKWHDWTRYSSRQKTAMQMGGVIGKMRLQGSSLQDWWPLLWYGQWLHLGKATSMGLGAYQLKFPQACGQQSIRQNGASYGI